MDMKREPRIKNISMLWGANPLRGLFVISLILLMTVPGAVKGMDRSDESYVTIVVNDTATVTDEKIRLKDIAMIRTETPALKEKLGEIEIGAAPKPGLEKRLSGRSIHTLIRPETIQGADVQLDLPETIVVRRESQEVPEARLLKLFQSVLDTAHPDGEVIISQFKVRGTNVFPQGAIELTPVPDNKEGLGIKTLSVNVMVDGKFSGALILSGKADIYKNVVCAKTHIQRGTTLTPADVCLNSINISKAPPDVLTRMDDVSGKLVTVNLREGAFLREKILSAPPVIEKGDKVKLVAEKGSLAIVTMGIAKTGGAEGDQIRVKNIASGKVVVGRVKDASTVEVLF